MSTISKYTHRPGSVYSHTHRHTHTFTQACGFDCFSLSPLEKKKIQLLCFPTVSAVTRAQTCAYTHQSQSTRHFYNKNWIPLRSSLKLSRHTGKLDLTSFSGVLEQQKRWLHTQSIHARKRFIPTSQQKGRLRYDSRSLSPV